MDWTGCDVVEVIPGKVSGVPILKGSRVQADAVLENAESGESVEDIAYNFDLNPESYSQGLGLCFGPSDRETSPLRILFDQNTPRNLVRHLEGHEVVRAAQLDWEELKNDDLLQAAEANSFDLFLTCDRNLEYQQNLQSRRIAIIALSTNNWPLIKPHVDQVKMAVNAAMPGSYLTVECGQFIKRKPSRNA